jgi:nicotinamide-nucleotide amidase
MSEVNASIITIGDELLIGQTIDTNSAFISQELNKIGIWVKCRIAVGDDKKEILSALGQQRSGAEVIIITGGLGPTGDDITKPVLCAYFGSQLIVNEEVLENVKNIFKKFNRPLTERNIKQAEVPDNCTVLLNERGTAPGMWFEKDNTIYVSLPGVPHEMKGLMESAVIPRLKELFSLPFIIHKTAVTIGQAESALAEILNEWEEALPVHIKLAYLPHYRMVKLRLTARGENKKELEQEIEKQFESLKSLVKEWMIADEDISIVEVLGKLLDEKAKFMASAESCTGGYIAHLLTSRSGSSSSFKGGVVSYANEAKENALGVQQATLAKWGAVSEETSKEMVRGVLQLMNVDYAVATSGIMGPAGGMKEKPVGTVWIAVGDKERVVSEKHFVHVDRKRNIEVTALIALNMLRKFILEQEK